MMRRNGARGRATHEVASPVRERPAVALCVHADLTADPAIVPANDAGAAARHGAIRRIPTPYP